jgi:putative ABC transport system ATP-binding protein
VNDPPVLLADEPTGNLDSKTTHEIMGLLQRLNREGTTILMVTHSEDCSAYAKRILRVSDGRLIDGDAKRLWRPYVSTEKFHSQGLAV